MEEVLWKIQKVRELMEEKSLSSFLITRNDNFSWITAGGRGWVVSGSDSSVAWVLVTNNSAYLVSNNIESRRLLENEVSEDFKLLEYKWYESPLDALRKYMGKFPASDGTVEGFLNLSEDIKNIRMRLSEWEIKRAEKIGTEIEETFEEILKSSNPNMTERELAGLLNLEFTKRGYELPVLLVFSNRTRNLYRHNLPGDEKLGQFFFASICARKSGLVLSITRSVAFGKIPDGIEDQHMLNTKIDAEIISKTETGKSLGDMFFKIREVYIKYGQEAEFEKHHQGGIAGYNSREEKATPDSPIILEPGMLIAWNPTITGTKSEDTFLLMEDEREFLTFTRNSKWPKLKFEIEGKFVERPGIMVL